MDICWKIKYVTKKKTEKRNQEGKELRLRVGRAVDLMWRKLDWRGIVGGMPGGEGGGG